MTKNRLLVIGAAALAVAGVLAWAFMPRPVGVEVATATIAPFEVTLDEDGKTRLAERTVVVAPLAGRLSRIALREGDRVEAGQPVATIAPLLPALLDERSRGELRARNEAAQAALARASARIARAQVSVEQAHAELRRTEQLAQQGFVAPTKLDVDRLALRAAREEQAAATEERHMAEHELQQARAALSAVQDAGTAARGFTVRSPVGGVVLRVVQASEGTVALATPLLEIGDIGRLEIAADVLTTEAPRARPGSPVRIERWGGAQALEGTVRRVEPAAFTKVSALGVEEQRVRVLIDITSPREQWTSLGDGYRVAVRIVTQREAQALQVPVAAVFPRPGAAASEGDGSMAVFVLDGGRVRQQAVQLAGRNGRHAAIVKGLQAGQQVVVYPPPSLLDGTRVTVRSP